MTKKAFIGIAVVLLAAAWQPAAALDRIPESSGFSGYVNAGVTYWSVANSMIVGGSPLVLNDVGDTRIESISQAPFANTSPGLFVGGEINYTFASTRTQLFLGNRLEDMLRMDMVVGAGMRQEIWNAGILALSALFTPVDLQFWADPYVEGEDRVPTDMNFPGYRLRWGQVLGTGLELTLTDRFYEFDNETSGDWLVSEGRLDPEQKALLDRSGDILRIQALYRFDIKGQRFEPAIRWVDDYHKGKAIANSGYELKLTWLFRSRRIVLDANILYGVREARETNPIYGKTMESDQVAAALVTFFPVKRYTSSILSVFAGIQTSHEDSNIDFYDSTITMVMAGVIWNHIRL